MTSLNFSNVSAIESNDYLAIFGQLKTSAPAIKMFDFTNNSTVPAIIITNSHNYDKMKTLYQHYPKSKRDLNIYSFDGIRYCKITSDSVKSLNGVSMSHNSPKLLSEIVFPKFDYDKNTNIDVYITLDHYNVIQTLNSEEIKNKFLNDDLAEFNKNLCEFRKAFPKTNIKFLISNKQTYFDKYFESLINFDSCYKLISIELSAICNYILESIVGHIVYGNVPAFNGFLLHDQEIHEPIYANTYTENLSFDELQNDNKSIVLTMRSNSIQIYGNGELNFLIIYKKNTNTNVSNIDTKFTIIEQLTGSELINSETLSSHLIDNSLVESHIEQLIELIEFKNLIKTIDITDKDKCKEFYMSNIEIISNLLFCGIQNFDQSNSMHINLHIYESSHSLFVSIKQNLNSIHQFHIVDKNLNHPFFGKNKQMPQLTIQTNAHVKEFTGPVLSQIPNNDFDYSHSNNFSTRFRSCN